MRLINVLHSKQFIFISPQIVSSQKFLCSKVNLQLLFEHKSHENKILGPPLQKHSIQEDGNCLFHALSYIVTGRQTDHHILRSKVNRTHENNRGLLATAHEMFLGKLLTEKSNEKFRDMGH